MSVVNQISYTCSNKYVSQMEMYAGRVACCSLVSRFEYTPCALLRLEKRQESHRTGRLTDERQTVTSCIPLRCGQHNNHVQFVIILEIIKDIFMSTRAV